MSILQKWKLSIDNKNFAGAVLMDLSKAFDTVKSPITTSKATCSRIQQTSFNYNM